MPALGDGSAGDGGSAGGGSVKDELDADEHALRNALAVRKGARGAAKAAAKAAAAAKDPAAAKSAEEKAACAKKRPAAALPEKFPVIPQWEDGDDERSRNTYTCKWSNRCDSLAAKLRVGAKRKVEERKKAVQLAGALWDKKRKSK